MTEMNTLGRLLDQVLDERLRFSRYTATRLCILFFFINPQILCNYCNRVTRFLCSCITYPGYDTSGSYQLRYNTSKGYQLGYTTSGGYHLGYNTSGGLSPRIQYNQGVITYPGYNTTGGNQLGYNTSGGYHLPWIQLIRGLSPRIQYIRGYHLGYNTSGGYHLGYCYVSQEKSPFLKPPIA